MDVHEVVAAARRADVAPDPLRVLRRQRRGADQGHPRRPARAQAGRGREPHPRADVDQPAGAARPTSRAWSRSGRSGWCPTRPRSRVLPWAPGSASVLCDQLGHDRQRLGRLPALVPQGHDRPGRGARRARAGHLRERVLPGPRREDGRYVPFDAPGHAPVYSAIGHDLNAALMVDTVDALAGAGHARSSRRSTSTARASRRSPSGTPTRSARRTTR